jgi:hypothetical protein
MFFEPLPTGDEAPAWELPEPPPWSGPPAEEAGPLLAVEQTVARSPNEVVRLPAIRVFGAGCMLDVEVVTRQGGDLSADDWWDLHASAYGGHHLQRSGEPLPRKLMRMGVRFADSTKATTIGQQPQRTRYVDEPPAGPLPSWQPGGSGMHGRHLGFSGFGLWLWPLPPAERFEFAAEWPFSGIELTITELDGAAIVAAAAGSRRYRPDTQPGSLP